MRVTTASSSVKSCAASGFNSLSVKVIPCCCACTSVASTVARVAQKQQSVSAMASRHDGV